jgi:hypothetical protein
VVIGGTTYKVTDTTISNATATQLTDIGESRVGWASGLKGTKTVVYLADSGLNTVYENNGAATTLYARNNDGTVKTDSFKKVTGLTDSAEKFVNFEQDGTWKSDYLITWGDVNAAGTGLNETTVVSVHAGDSLNAYMDAMEAVFNDNNKAIFAGTKDSQDLAKDKSDTMTWKQFKAEYLYQDTDADTDSAVNGDWLKVIDNDGDGKADYVFKTVFAITDVAKVATNGTVTLTAKTALTDTTDPNYITNKTTMVNVDDAVKDDVVLYTVIDGNAYIKLAETATKTIDSVNRNKLTATTTDGDTYEQSGVEGTAYLSSTDFDEGVKNLAGKTSYDLYFDAFGYLTVFTETENSGNFVLLTDGYYKTDRSENTYAVMAYVDGALKDTDVTGGGSLFINTSNDNNGWSKLKTFGALNNSGINGAADSIHTTVASLSDSGVLTAVDNAFNKKTIEMIDLGTTIVDRAGVDNGVIYTSNTRGDAYTVSTTTDAEVRALTTTVYYFVYKDGNKTVVNEYDGVNAVPTLSSSDKTHIEDVYAVATKVSRADGSEYYNANVVVVEFDQGYRTNAEQIFVYDSPEVGSNVSIETLDVIRADGTQGSVRVDLKNSTITRTYDPAYGKLVLPGLYYLWPTTTEGVYTIEQMTSAEIAANRYAVGTVKTSTYTTGTDWTEITTYQKDYDTDDTEATGLDPEYKNVDSSNYYTLGYKNNGLDSTTHYYDYTASLSPETDDLAVLFESNSGTRGVLDNHVLVSYDRNNNIIYAISFNQKDGTSTNYAYNTVWTSVLPQESAPVGAPVVTFYGVTDNASKDQDNTDNKIQVSWTTATNNNANPLTVTNGTYVVRTETNGGGQVTSIKTTPNASADETYYVTVLGDDGSVAEYTLVQKAKDNTKSLSGGNITLPTTAPYALIPDYLSTWTPGYDEATLTWAIKLKGQDAYQVFDASNVPAIIANASSENIEDIIAIVTAEDGTVDGIGVNGTTYYDVTLPDGVSAYYDAAHQYPAVGRVKTGDTLYLVADGDGTLAGDNTTISDSTYNSTTGKTTGTLSSIDANTEVSFTGSASTLASAKTDAIAALRTTAGARISNADVKAVVNAGIAAINAETTTTGVTSQQNRYKGLIETAIADASFTTATALSDTALTTALNGDETFEGIEKYVTNGVTAAKDGAKIKVTGTVSLADQYDSSESNSVPGFGQISDYLTGGVQSTKVAFIAVQIDNADNDVIILIVGNHNNGSATVKINDIDYTIDLTGVTFAS